MSTATTYTPGPAAGARVEKDGENWTLVLTRELRHSPEKVWAALTDPEQLKEWAPYDADRSMGTARASVNLTTVGAPGPHVTEVVIKRAEPPKVLEFDWAGPMRWELEPFGKGTRVTLWAVINRKYIAWGAAGWHICLDVLDHLLAGDPIGRRAGPQMMGIDSWKRLKDEYADQFGVEAP